MIGDIYKMPESFYKKCGVIVVKDSMSNKWRLVQVEDALIYSKEVQKYLDKLI